MKMGNIHFYNDFFISTIESLCFDLKPSVAQRLKKKITFPHFIIKR